jgi:excisionase family DNA binding protein
MKSQIHWRDRLGLRVADAAAVLGICRSKIWTMIQTGELESFKIGGSRLVRTDSVIRLAGKSGEQDAA